MQSEARDQNGGAERWAQALPDPNHLLLSDRGAFIQAVVADGVLYVAVASNGEHCASNG